MGTDSIQTMIGYLRSIVISILLPFLLFKLQIVLEHLDIFGWVSHLDEWPYEYSIICQLHNIIGPVHVYLHIILLELAELVLFHVIYKWILGSSEMTSQYQETMVVFII